MQHLRSNGAAMDPVSVLVHPIRVWSGRAVWHYGCPVIIGTTRIPLTKSSLSSHTRLLQLHAERTKPRAGCSPNTS